VSECESFSSRRVKAANVPARISPHQPVPIAEALSAKTSCALIPSGDSFRVCRAFIGPWLSLVERLVRDEEVASSNLAGPTNTQCLRSSAGEVRTSVRLPARSAQPGASQIFVASVSPPAGFKGLLPTERLDDGEMLATNALVVARGCASGPVRARRRC
jgi:hypothetical protein